MRKVSTEKRQAIIEAAENLVREGIDSPTNDEIRERMGGGSLADISPVMREWREHIPPSIELPGAVKSAGEKFVTQLWSAASKATELAIESSRIESEERVRVCEAERNEALNEIAVLEARLASMEQQLQERDLRIENQEKNLGALSEKNHLLDLEREKATTHAGTLKKTHEDTKTQLKEAQSHNEYLQKKLLDIAEKQKA